MIESSGRRLRISVSPYPDESLLSLVARSAFANVFPRTTRILELAGIVAAKAAFAPFTASAKADALSFLLSKDVIYVQARMHEPVITSGAEELVNWFDTVLPRRFIESAHRRFSAGAIQAAPYQRARWMIRPLPYCSETMEYLHQKCPRTDCGKDLGWTIASGIEKCEHCGFDLCQTTRVFVPEELRPNLKLAADLVSTSVQERSVALAAFPGPLNMWEPGQVFSALVELGALTGSIRENKIGQAWPSGKDVDFAGITPEHVAEGVTFLLQWPLSFRTLISKIALEASERRESDAYASFLGPFRKYFSKHAPDTPLRQLIEAESAVALQNLALPVRFYRHKQSFRFRSREVITATEAKRAYGVEFKILKRLDKGGKSVINRVSYAKGTKIYNPQMLESSCQSYLCRLISRDAAREVGLPTYILPQLANAGLFTEITDHDARLMAGSDRLYHKESFARFVEKMQNLGCEANECGVSLYEAIGHRRVEPLVWAKIFAAVIAGQLRLLRIDDQATGLCKRLCVDAAEIRTLLRAVAELDLPDVKVSGAVAEWILGVTPYVIQTSIDAGLLPAVGKLRNFEIQLKDIVSFRMQYIAPKEVAQMMGISLRKVAHNPDTILSFSPIEPRGRRFLLWRRPEVEDEIRWKRMNACAA